MTTATLSYDLNSVPLDSVVEYSLRLAAEAIATDPAVAKEFDVVFGFNVKPGAFKLGSSTYTGDTEVATTQKFTLNGKKASEGKDKVLTNKIVKKDTQLTFTVFENEWKDILSGKLDCIAAFMGGIMLIEGDVALAMKLPNLVTLCRGQKITK